MAERKEDLFIISIFWYMQFSSWKGCVIPNQMLRCKNEEKTKKKPHVGETISANFHHLQAGYQKAEGNRYISRTFWVK